MIIAQLKISKSQKLDWCLGTEEVFNGMNVIIYSLKRDSTGRLGYHFGNKMLQKGVDMDTINETSFWLPVENFKNVVEIRRKCYDL